MTLFVFLQPTPTSKFIQGYAGAVTSAVSIAVSGFNTNTVYFGNNFYHVADVLTAALCGCIKSCFYLELPEI